MRKRKSVSTTKAKNKGTKRRIPKEEVAKKNGEKEPPPNIQLLLLANRYLLDLEALREMFITVLPVLAQKDKDRDAKIKEWLRTRLVKKKDGPKLSVRITDFQEFIANALKLRRADILFRQHSIVAVVSRFDEFLSGVLSIALHARPEWLRSDKTITYTELLELQSIQSAISGVVQKEIDSLMRGSHVAQIEYLDEKLKLGIKENFKGLPEFLEVVERRNLFVHTGGRVSQQYIDDCGRWGAPRGNDTKIGQTLEVEQEYFERAFRLSFELGLRISQASYRRLFPETSQLHAADRDLNHLSIRFLELGDWELAEMITDFEIAIPEKLRAGGEQYFFAVINRAIAQKFGGKDYKSGLKGITWDAFHPKYKLALEVLNDDFGKAEKTMQNEAVKEAIGEDGFRSWPLFRKFRSTEEFARAYKEMFRRNYVPDPKRDIGTLEKEISRSVTSSMPIVSTGGNASDTPEKK